MFSVVIWKRCVPADSTWNGSGRQKSQMKLGEQSVSLMSRFPVPKLHILRDIYELLGVCCSFVPSTKFFDVQTCIHDSYQSFQENVKKVVDEVKKEVHSAADAWSKKRIKWNQRVHMKGNSTGKTPYNLLPFFHLWKLVKMDQPEAPSLV